MELEQDHAKLMAFIAHDNFQKKQKEIKEKKPSRRKPKKMSNSNDFKLKSNK